MRRRGRGSRPSRRPVRRVVAAVVGAISTIWMLATTAATALTVMKKGVVMTMKAATTMVTETKMRVRTVHSLIPLQIARSTQSVLAADDQPTPRPYDEEDEDEDGPKQKQEKKDAEAEKSLWDLVQEFRAYLASKRRHKGLVLFEKQYKEELEEQKRQARWTRRVMEW
jgi:hypothetical protein